MQNVQVSYRVIQSGFVSKAALDIVLNEKVILIYEFYCDDATESIDVRDVLNSTSQCLLPVFSAFDNNATNGLKIMARDLTERGYEISGISWLQCIEYILWNPPESRNPNRFADCNIPFGR